MIYDVSGKMEFTTFAPEDVYIEKFSIMLARAGARVISSTKDAIEFKGKWSGSGIFSGVNYGLIDLAINDPRRIKIEYKVSIPLFRVLPFFILLGLLIPLEFSERVLFVIISEIWLAFLWLVFILRFRAFISTAHERVIKNPDILKKWL